MAPQQRSAAAFSRLGDSAFTKRRSAASICRTRGFSRRKNFLGRWESGMVRRCYQCAASRAIKQNRARPKKPPRSEDCGYSVRARIAEGGGSHIIRSLPGKGQTPLKGSAVTESANDNGRRGNPETAAASLSIPHGGRDRRGGPPQAHRWHQECFDQSVLLSGAFSRQAGEARRLDS